MNVHFGIFRGLQTSTELHLDFEFFDSRNISDNFYRIINIQAEDYFSRKIYNNEFGNILHLVASNTFCIRIIICTAILQQLNECTTILPCPVNTADN